MLTKAANIDPQAPDFHLHPIDKEILESTGDLPGLPLLISPADRRRLSRPPPSVHTLETKLRKPLEGAESLPAQHKTTSKVDSEYREDFTYRGYLLRTRRDWYARSVEIYSEVDGPYSHKFMDRLRDCRRYACFLQNKVTKTLKIQSSRCKLRWCPICRDVQRRIVTHAVDDWLKVQRYPKMITLTLLHSDDPLQLQITRIYKCFKKLRTRAYFQRLITGGVWFFQLKFNQEKQQWHPHIHCLVAGAFLPHNRLKSLWHEITGDSFVVDIRGVKDLENASVEVARYATSPADITKVNLEKALDIYYSTKGRRICGSWGSAKSVTMKPTVQDDVDDWFRVADFYFVNVQKEHDQDSKTFWQCFILNKPYDGPRLQPDKDLYREEIDAALPLDDFPQTDKEWYLRIKRNRGSPWNKFFTESEN